LIPVLPSAQVIADNVARVREAIARAAERSHRRAEEIHLIAVSKYVDVQAVEALIEAGCHDLGESRPQELWQKAEQLIERPVRWHMIGHLQRNKVRRTLPWIGLLHSGDSQRLLEAVNEEAVQTRRSCEVLIEVNVSGDESKHGFRPEDVAPVLAQACTWPGLRIRGLMAMAAWGTTPEEARRDFAALRELRDRLAGSAPPEVSLEHLSMGMSGDFEAAIEEGATMVRVGSALFEGTEL
jgi:pyridoxal phosphate enzyme (YggS family)